MTQERSIEEIRLANDRHRVMIVAGVIMGAFLAALDNTILATVMPTIVGDLGGLDLYSWVFSVYMIMTAVSMPIWGKLSDAWGKKKLFMLAVGMFLAGSFLCGASASMVQLIIFRGIQGIGAGGLAAVPFALLSTVFPMHERGKALGLLASAWGISSIIGPLIGGGIVMYTHWRWVFYINLPLGAAAIATIARAYAEASPPHRERVDYAGAALLTVSIVSLLLLVMQIGVQGSVAGLAAYALIVLVFLTLFIRQERRAPSPLLELGFFRLRTFWVGNLLGFIASFAMFGVVAFVPLFAQSVQGGTAIQAALVITPMSLSWSGASIIAGRLTHRIGENTLVRFGMALMVAGYILALFTAYNSGATFLGMCVFVLGAGMGSLTPALMLSVQHSLGQKNVGVATSTQMLSRTIGGAVGVAVMGAAMTGSMSSQISDLGAQGSLSSFPEAIRDLFSDPQKVLDSHLRTMLSADQLMIILSAFTRALHTVFITGLLVIVLGLALSMLLPRSVLHEPAARGGDLPMH